MRRNEGTAGSPSRNVPVDESYKLVSRSEHPEDTIVAVGAVEIGAGRDPVLMAGPCAVESRAQCEAIADEIAAAGVKIMRGGAFKPRTSPYSFQGLGEEGLKILSAAARARGLLIVSEAMDASEAEIVARYADIVQIGSRNMMNYAFLKKIAGLGKPFLLKRGMYARLDEFLYAAEYLLAGGAKDVILCERGIRTFDAVTRNMLDIAAVPLLKQMTHLPVVVDPSHASGRRDIVPALARAAVAAGADGLLVEVSEDPNHCHCDGEQSLTFDQFREFIGDMAALAPCVARRRARGPMDEGEGA